MEPSRDELVAALHQILERMENDCSIVITCKSGKPLAAMESIIEGELGLIAQVLLIMLKDHPEIMALMMIADMQGAGKFKKKENLDLTNITRGEG